MSESSEGCNARLAPDQAVDQEAGQASGQAGVILDARGLLCPMPIVRLSRKIREIPVGSVLEVWADDEGATSDVPAWCHKTGNQYLGMEDAGAYKRYFVRRVTQA